MVDEKLFKKLIICGHCGKRMTPINERGTIRYLCSTYHHAKDKCVRNIIDEDSILDIVSYHSVKHSISIIRSNTHMKEIITSIIIYYDERYTIEFIGNIKCGWVSPTVFTM